MITVNTFRKIDYRALIAAGMSKTQQPVSIKQTNLMTCLTFSITKQVYDKLDLNNRNDVTIQTVR